VIIQAWQSGDAGALKGLLAQNATFSSPVTDYVGDANVSHMLGLIAQVLEDVRPGPEWNAGDETVSEFTARCQGDEMQGVLREQRDVSGALVHVTLFLRPYRTLRTAIARMGELLARDPVPVGSPGTGPRPGQPVRGSATGRPVMALFDLIGRRWTLRIIWELRQSSRPLTFRELRSACGDLSSSVLTRRLHELTDVRLTTHSGDGYALTDTGNRLVASLQPVLEWSRGWNRELAGHEMA
jgi:DNA-binding HxlR family transcriptional regulator